MRLIIVLTMLIASLLYGFMPAQAAGMASQQVHSTHAPTAPAAHSGHAMMPMTDNPEPVSSYQDPCPHRGGPAHNSFCAACLAIVPDFERQREGYAPFSRLMPAPEPAFAARSPAPLEPPPRS